MRFLALTIAALASTATTALAAEEVKIEIIHAGECERRSQKGDTISVHYRGTFASNGEQFDASYTRGTPLKFKVGKGMVIKGWDDNLVDMCIGDKRILTIPPEFAYGNTARGGIPPGSTLIFETELMGIDGVEAPQSSVEKSESSTETSVTSSASEKVTEEATKATEASETSEATKATGSTEIAEATEAAAATEEVKETTESKVAEATEVPKEAPSDTDESAPEHTEHKEL